MSRVIDAILRLTDEFSSPAQKTIGTMTSMSKKGVAMGKQIEKAGQSISKVGKGLTTTLTLPIVGLGVTAVKTASDFEKAMSQVSATMGTTTDQIPELTALAEEMGAKTAFSAVESAEGINILAMAGLNSQQIIEALPTVLDLASAGAMDMASSASYVTGAVKGFSDEMSNAGYYADLMAKGATLANTDVASLGEALGGISSTASSYGQTADSVTLALLRLAEQNVTGSEASTRLARTMADIYTPSDNAKKAFKKLGIEIYDADNNARDFNDIVNDMAKAFDGMSEKEANAYKDLIFTQNGMKGFNAMTVSTTETINRFKEGLSGASGSASQQAQTQLDNLSGQITILKSGLEGLAIAFGNKLLPYLKKGVGIVQQVIDKLNGMSDAEFEQIIKIAGIVASIGPAITIFGKLVSVFGKGVQIFNKVGMAIKGAGGIIGALSGPVGIAVAVVAGLVAVGVLVYRNFDHVKASFQKIVDAFNSGTGIIGNLGNVLKGLVEGLKTGIEPILNGIEQLFNGLIDFITGVLTGDWEQAWQGLVDIFGGIFETITGVAKSVVNGVAGAINAVIGAINGAGFTIPDWVPVVGGKSFSLNIPLIPYLAKGTENWQGGLAHINEQGGEIVDLPRGSRVYPHDESIKKARAEGGNNITIPKLADTIIVREDADIDRIADSLVRKLQKVALAM